MREALHLLGKPFPGPTRNGPSVVGRAGISYDDAKSILTRATGFISGYKFTLNPYGGCGFGCDYCYARYFTANSERRQAWGQWVAVKRNAEQLIARACRSGALRTGDAVYMSSATDPYQPVEKRLALTRSLLETLLASGVQPRLTVQTRSPLALRDVDLFRRFERIRVNFTIGTDCEEVRVRYEPHAPSVSARFKAAQGIAAAGVKIGVAISPMLPVRDVEAFGFRLAKLNAAQYVAQYFHAGDSPFAAGTGGAVMRLAREDGWSRGAYRQAFTRLARALRTCGPLLEGAEGFAPE
jgi:DNA repair photolyase